MNGCAWAGILVFVTACGELESAPKSPVAHARDLSGAEPEVALAERVRQVVLAQRVRLRACYEAGLARTPTLAGRVILVVQVEQSGRAEHVYDARREGLGPEEITCLSRVLRATRFHDGAASAVKVEVPLSFAPAEEP
jgi:hypothetical protein